jgi:sugar phosphate isomerase/epimerase
MVDLALSIITDEYSDEFDEVCEHLQSKDVQYVELRNVWMGNIIEISDEFVGDSLDIIKDAGLKVSCLATPLLKCLPPSVNPQPKNKTDYTENWAYNFSKIDRAIELAKKYQCKYIRVFGFQGKWPIREIKDWNTWEIYKEWQTALNQMKAKVAAHEMILVCENESGLVASLEQIEKVGHENCDNNFGMLFDTANVAIHYGQNGVLTDEWLRRLGKYIKYIHAKGCIQYGTEYQAAPVNTEGCIIRWPAILKYFRELPTSAYAKTGTAPNPLFVSVETHMGKENKWANTDRSLKNLQQLFN